MYGYSCEGEVFYGNFSTPEEAAIEGCHGPNGESRRCIVGEYRQPLAPEESIDAEDIIDNIMCQDDYSMDCAYGCFRCSKEIMEELESSLRAAFVEWMNKHDLHPVHRVVDADTMHWWDITDGKPVCTCQFC